MRFSIDHVIALSKGIFNPYLLLAAFPYIFYRDPQLLNTLTETPIGFPLLDVILAAIRNSTTALVPLTIPALIGGAVRLNGYLNRRIVDQGIKDKYDWPKEVAIITGGSGAVGSATAQKLVEMGVGAVVLVDVRDPPAELLKNERVHFYRCDISAFENVQKIAHEIKGNHGNPTILILASGIIHAGPIISTPNANIETSIKTNLLGPIYALKAFVAPMTIPNHGHIISLTSSLSSLPVPFTLDHSSSEVALQNLISGFQSETFNYYRASRLRYSSITTSLINTSLANYARLPDSFLYPLVETSDVANKIGEILQNGDSVNVVLPKAGYIPLIIGKLCPDWLRWSAQYAASRMQIFTYLRPTEVHVEGKNLMLPETPEFTGGFPKSWWDTPNLGDWTYRS